MNREKQTVMESKENSFVVVKKEEAIEDDRWLTVDIINRDERWVKVESQTNAESKTKGAIKKDDTVKQGKHETPVAKTKRYWELPVTMGDVYCLAKLPTFVPRKILNGKPGLDDLTEVPQYYRCKHTKVIFIVPRRPNAQCKHRKFVYIPVPDPGLYCSGCSCDIAGAVYWCADQCCGGWEVKYCSICAYFLFEAGAISSLV